MRIVLELIVVTALVSFGTHFPTGESSAKAWRFITHHPLLLLHLVFGSIVVGEAALLRIGAHVQRRREWIVVTTLGLVCVLIAWALGENFVAAQHLASLDKLRIE
jgi:hypothetical protein